MPHPINFQTLSWGWSQVVINTDSTLHDIPNLVQHPAEPIAGIHNIQHSAYMITMLHGTQVLFQWFFFFLFIWLHSFHTIFCSICLAPITPLSHFHPPVTGFQVSSPLLFLSISYMTRFFMFYHLSDFSFRCTFTLWLQLNHTRIQSRFIFFPMWPVLIGIVFCAWSESRFWLLFISSTFPSLASTESPSKRLYSNYILLQSLRNPPISAWTPA